MTYCSSLTRNQLLNVLRDENERRKRGGEVGEAAQELYQEAREECIRRGIEPDEHI